MELAPLICKTVPEILLRYVEDGWEAGLYVHMHQAWTAYFASRISARFDPAFGGGYRDMLLASTEKARQTISRDRLAYRTHGNLMEFLEPAISSVGRIMMYAGMLLGHCDGLCQSVYDDNGSLTQVLDKIGLRGWMDALRRDLGGLFERRDAWESCAGVPDPEWTYRTCPLAVWCISLEDRSRGSASRNPSWH